MAMVRSGCASGRVRVSSMIVRVHGGHGNRKVCGYDEPTTMKGVSATLGATTETRFSFFPLLFVGLTLD